MDSFHVSVERTLVALQAVALCCLLTAAALRIADSVQVGEGLPVALTWLAVTPIIAVLWFLRPRIVGAGHGVGWTMLSVLMSTPIAVFGSLDFTIPALLLVVAFAVVDVSLRAGVHATVWISCVGFALHVLGNRASWDAVVGGALQGLVNVVPVAVLLCFGIVLGLSLRSFEERRHDDQSLIDRLLHTADIEKELLLSDERARSARELHDGLGHRLTLISMSLELAERMRGVDAQQAWDEVRTAKDTTGDALAEMRMWVRALNPVREAGAQGVAALELIAESFRRTGLSVVVTSDDDSDRELARDDVIALLIYRTVQEGLTNALRHARARTVRIDLGIEEQRMELSISNDFGRTGAAGPAATEPVLGFGLRGIADRAAEHRGSMNARRTDREFLLDVVVPLSSAAASGRQEAS